VRRQRWKGGLEHGEPCLLMLLRLARRSSKRGRCATESNSAARSRGGGEKKSKSSNTRAAWIFRVQAVLFF